VKGRILPHELFHGIDGIEPARPEAFIVPRIFADGHSEAHSIELDDFLGPEAEKYRCSSKTS